MGRSEKIISTVVYVITGLLITLFHSKPIFWLAFILLFLMSVYNIYKKPSLGNILFYPIADSLTYWFLLIYGLFCGNSIHH